MSTETFLNGRVTLHAGDCLDRLREIPDASLDACVCDPPYALVSITKRFGKPGAAPNKVPEGGSGVYARATSGFMGKTWDTGERAFAVEFWAEVYRVLKPGGHVAAFGGTRTYHRLTCAIEDAGFEVRDRLSYFMAADTYVLNFLDSLNDAQRGAFFRCMEESQFGGELAWVFGCLSDDTEILTENGWVLGVNVQEGQRVAAWDAETGAITLQAIERVTLAPYSGDLVRFVNDDTDQLLTSNHRVYHLPSQRKMTSGVRRRWYETTYQVAEAGAINRWNPLKLPCAGMHDGPGIGGVDYAALLGWVWTEGGFDHAPSKAVRVYQSESANLAKAQEIEALFARVCPSRKRYDRIRPYTYNGVTRDYSETCWFFTGDLAQRVRADLPNKQPTWDLLWRMSQAEKLAFLDAAMKGDGSGDDFYQKAETDLIWFQALLATVGQRGKIVMRNAPRTGGSVCITPRATTEFQRRHLVEAAQPYQGTVWCVKVPTGAFVARRNGKVFITGNSGFPKSHDVSKGIDAKLLLGAARTEDIRRLTMGADYRPSERGRVNYDHGGGSAMNGGGARGPQTDEAKAWEGWGSALKPALEPICLARKPLDGTIAENVLAHGTGGLNIAGCRIGTPDELRAGAGVLWSHQRKGEASAERRYTAEGSTNFAAMPGPRGGSPDGRWPANVLHDGSEEVIAAFPEAPGQQRSVGPEHGAKSSVNVYGDYGARDQFVPRGDGGSAARFFYSAKADADDRIGSKHPTVKPVDLMRWLVRLVTPPGGTVLDPFAGTGTTGEAAYREGFSAVLVEREAEYRTDIARRMDLVLAGPDGRKHAIAKVKAKPDDLAGTLFAPRLQAVE